MLKKITFAILAGAILFAPGDSLGQRGGGRGGGRGGFNTSGASSIVVGIDDAQITLIPYPEKNWIIARAPAEVLKEIEQWIIKLDLEETDGQPSYDTISVSYVDVDEVASRLNEVMSEINVEIQKNIFIQPLVQSRQLLVFGKDDYRQMVSKLVSEIDLPSNQLQRQTFKLKYADPEDIKLKLDELYSMTGSSSLGTSRSRTSITRISSYGMTGASSLSADTVITTTYPSLRQLTVLASPDNIEKITTMIEEWDSPIPWEEVAPRIIEVENVDPVQMVELLTTLFSSSGSSGSSTMNTRQMLNLAYGNVATDQERIIGPLYGKLTFADVPGTKKIIVVSSISEAYDIVEALVQQLDKEEMAEVPKVIELKFADPERLCEVLNAMFCEAGSSVEILRSASGLGTYSMDESGTGASDTGQEGYTPWWSSPGARTTTDTERPISNVIGKIRFVPETRTKSVLILSPPEFLPNIEQLIAELDVPGRQVMVKAIIVEVDHSSMTSLGVQLAPTGQAGFAFGTMDENTATIVNQLQYLDDNGFFSFAGLADFTAMIDFLIKNTNAQVLNQQTLWTEDNEEASFFKGSRVAFLGATTSSPDVGTTQSVEFSRVGMNLAVRPSITPKNQVDMIVNIIISQITADEQNGQPVRTEMETQTNMIVQDGQTTMLGGILFQEDRVTRRKVPLLGDIPLLGGLFSHDEIKAANNEMLVFITPYVVDIDDPDAMLPSTIEQINLPTQKLDNIREQLDATMETLQQK